MASAVAPRGGVRVAPIVTGIILTFLLLWMLGATADVFLLLFIAIGVNRILHGVGQTIGDYDALLAAILITLMLIVGNVVLLCRDKS